MKGPDPRCPECAMPLTQVAKWKEEAGEIWSWYCEHCGWKERGK